ERIHRTRRALELRDGRFRDVLVLLRGAAADPASALDHAVPDDRHGAHARDHVAAGMRDDALDDWAPGALLQFAAGPSEPGRGDGLALRAVDRAPDGAVHAVERHQAAAGVTDRRAHLDVHLLGLGDGRLHDAIGFGQCQCHGSPSYSAVVPPSMTSSLPVMYEDSSDARYITPYA